MPIRASDLAGMAGDTLTAKARVEAIRIEDGGAFVDVAVSTRNQEGDEVLTGYATARLDRRPRSRAAAAPAVRERAQLASACTIHMLEATSL
jgi:hypothetical protein